MSGSSASPSAPTVVPPGAAERIRSFVFENRDRPVLSPHDVVTMLLTAGLGTNFDEQVRTARLATWVNQVLRRLRKKGWLHLRTDGEWSPTAALERCGEARALARNAPAVRDGRVPPSKPAVRAQARTAPAARPERVKPAKPTAPPAVESWPLFVERWVFEHRKAPFGIGDLVADMLWRGFGRGAPEERLREARRIAEEELRVLEGEILLDREGNDVWRPTELLRDWPAA